MEWNECITRRASKSIDPCNTMNVAKIAECMRCRAAIISCAARGWLIRTKLPKS